MSTKINSSKYLILGGAGFIGSAVTNRLLETGNQARVFSRHGYNSSYGIPDHPNLEWFCGDFQNKADIAEALNGVDTVVHLITSVVPKSSNDDPAFDLTSNVLPTLWLLDSMLVQGVSKIIFASSGGTVYGPPLHSPIPEDHPTNPIVAYGVSKLAIEKYLFLYKKLHGLQPVILRMANAYGERQGLDKSQGAVGVFLNNALHKTPIQIWGDGSVTRDYIYVGDVADAFLAAANYKGAHSLFNIGVGGGTTLNKLLQHITDLLGEAPNVTYQASRSFDVAANILDTALAKKELNWQPKTTMPDGLKNTLEWMKLSSGGKSS